MRGARSVSCAVACALLLAVSAAVAVAATPPRALSPGDHVETLTVGHLERTFILHVPPGRSLARRPLILVFHGRDTTALATERGTDLAAIGDRTGEVVAFLQGVDDSWNEQASGSTTPAARGRVNDVGYTVAVIARIERTIGFDHRRIIAVGFSNGAEMVEDLGCKLAGTLAQVVPVEGQLPRTTAATCRPTRAISVYEIHGTADTAIPYGGGPINGRGIVVLSAPRSIARWAQLDRCAPTPSTSRLGATIRLTRYAPCGRRVGVTLRTIVGGVHEWPSDIGEVVTAALPPP